MALLPDPDPADIFYDIEGDPVFDSDGGLEYLHGLWRQGSGGATSCSTRSRSHDREQERAGFEKLVDFFIDAVASKSANAHLPLRRLPR